MTELIAQERCEYCGAYLRQVPAIWKTKYGNLEVTNLECHNPRCPETKRRTLEESP